MRILLLSGGSGGHISPALAIVPELQKLDPEAEIAFVCSKSPLDIEILTASGQKFYAIHSGKLRRYFSLRNFFDLFLIAAGFWESLVLLWRFRPTVIFSKGGFVSVPAAWAARVFRIPLIIHESDAVPGLANRLVSKRAAKILTAFPSTFGEWVGTPVRPAFLQADPQAGKNFLGFSGDKPIVLAFAGSQGSVHINEVLHSCLDALLPMADIVWITGKNFVQPGDRPGLRAFAYVHDQLPHLLAAADLVVCRSGSNSLFEVAALQKPMLLIPHPHTGGDHQRKNAELFVAKGAAEMILDSDLTPELLISKITNLLSQPQKRESLAQNAAKLHQPDAAKKIAEAVIAVGKGG